MEGLFEIVVFLIAIGVLSRFMRGARGGRKDTASQSQQAPEADWDLDEEPGDKRAPASLEELIREELGINLERRPKIEAPPRTASRRRGVPAGTVQPERRPRPDPSPGRQPGADRPQPGPHTAVYPRRLPEELERARRSAAVVPEWAARVEPRLSLEEMAIRERGEAVSLEVPRAPEAHREFHERYEIPRPPATHEEFHRRYIEPKPRVARRGPAVRLPEFPGWTPAQKAIVWADILGPPRGLTL